jgi:hypothetical protein
MKSKIILLTAAVGLIVHTGCKSHEGSYAPVVKESHETENREPLVLMDPGAQRSISTTGIQRRTLEDGRIEATSQLFLVTARIRSFITGICTTQRQMIDGH